ncbi:unnamed protein product [Urochloa humidicola]
METRLPPPAPLPHDRRSSRSRCPVGIKRENERLQLWAGQLLLPGSRLLRDGALIPRRCSARFTSGHLGQKIGDPFSESIFGKHQHVSAQLDEGNGSVSNAYPQPTDLPATSRRLTMCREAPNPFGLGPNTACREPYS